MVDGIAFELKQFHFHAPGENRIEGKEHPLEAHLVYADKDGNLAVVAVMIEAGEANEVISGLGCKCRKKQVIEPGGQMPYRLQVFCPTTAITTASTVR